MGLRFGKHLIRLFGRLSVCVQATQEVPRPVCKDGNNACAEWAEDGEVGMEQALRKGFGGERGPRLLQLPLYVGDASVQAKA